MSQLSLTTLHNQVILPSTPSFTFGEASEESFAAEWAKLELMATTDEPTTSENAQPETTEVVLIEHPDTAAHRSDHEAPKETPKTTPVEGGNPISVASGTSNDDVLSTPAAIGRSVAEQDSAVKTASPQYDVQKPQLPPDQQPAVRHILPDPGKNTLPKQVSAEPIQTKTAQPAGQPVVLKGDAGSDPVAPIGSRLPNPTLTQSPVSLENPAQNQTPKSLPVGASAPSELTRAPEQVAPPAKRPVAELILQSFTPQVGRDQTSSLQMRLPIQMVPIDTASGKQSPTIHPDAESGTLSTSRPEQALHPSSLRSRESVKGVRLQTTEQQPTFRDDTISRTEFRPIERTEVLRYEPQASVAQSSAVSAATQTPPVFFGAPTTSVDLSAPADQPSVLPVAELESKTLALTISPQTPPSKPELAQVVIRQLAVVVPQVSERPVEVLLNPEELGRVRMVMLGQDAQMVVQIHADKPETSDLIRRHLEMLAQDFQELGYSDISFSFSNQRENNAQSQDETSSDTSLPNQPTDTPTAPQLLLPQSGLDLRL